MKKKLALILSIVLVLAAAACVFAFTANADELPYAAQQANAIWNDALAETKPTSDSATFIADKITINKTIVNSGTNGSLVGVGGLTAGSYTFKDGVLTLDSLAASDSIAITANGALWVKFTNTATFKGSIRNAWDYYAIAAHGCNNDTAADVWDKYLVQNFAPLIVEGADAKVGVTLTGGGNTIRSSGAIVVFGNVGFNIGDGGYDGIISDANSGARASRTYNQSGKPVILAPAKGMTATLWAGGAGAPLENRGGDIVFSGEGSITVRNTNASNAGAAMTTTPSSSLSKACGSIKFIEDVSVRIEVAGGPAIKATTTNVLNDGDAIVFDTTGTVDIISSAFSSEGWGGKNALIWAANGSIRVSGKSLVRASQTVAKFSGGSASLVTVSNNSHSVKVGFIVEDDAEFVGYQKANTGTTAIRMSTVWVNDGGHVSATDNGKLTLQRNQNGVSVTSGGASGGASILHFKDGFLNISDNAKVYLAEQGTSQDYYAIASWEAGNPGGVSAAPSEANSGYNVTGGQLEVYYANCPFRWSGSGDGDPAIAHNFSDCVFLVHSSSGYPFGGNFAKDPFANAKYANILVHNQGGNTDKTSNFSEQYNRNKGTDWACFYKDAEYTYYNGIQNYASVLGATPITDNVICDVVTNADNSVSYLYTIPFSTVEVKDTPIQNSYKVNGNVHAFAKGTPIVSGAPLSIAITDDAKVIKEGYVVFTDSDGKVVYIFDDASDNIASVYTTKNGGTVSYDDKTQDATFNGVSAQSAVIYAPDDNVTATAVGANVFTTKFSFENVNAGTGKAVVTGDANASITLNTATQYAFYSGRPLIFAGDLTVTINTSKADGIHTGNGIGIVVQDNAKVTVNSTANRAVRTQGNVEVKGGSLTVTGTNQVLYAQKAIVISGGSVTAYADKKSGGSYHAILAGTGMTVSGGTVKAYAGSTEAVEVSSGNYTQTGGNVTVSTYDDVNYTWKCGGLQVAKGDATISGGTLIVKSSGWAEGTADGEYGGSLAAKNITVSGNAVVKAYSVCTPISGDTHRGARAIRAMSGLTVKDSASVYVEAETAGIDIAAGGLKISDTASVEIKSTFDDSDYAYAQTLVDGTKDGDGKWTWTGAKRGFLRSAGCNMLYVRAGGVTVSGGSLKVSGTSESVAQIAGGITISGGSMTVNGATELIPNAKWTEVGPSGDATKYLVSSFDGNNFSGVNSIRLGSGDLNVSGGSLTVTGRIRSLFVEKGSVNLTGGTVTVTGTSSDALQSSNGKITVDGGSLIANGGTRAIYAVKGLDVKKGSLTATTTGNDTVRVDSEGLKISGGTVKATAGSVSSCSRALYAKNTNITVSGGTVNAIAGWSTIYAENGSITISGGSVTAEGDSNIVQNSGTGGITVSGGSLKSTANGTECAIRATKYEQSNGEVTLKAPKNVLDANRNTGADGNLTVSGGILRATATIGNALDGNVVTVSGDAQVYASSPANNNYEGVVQAVTYNQEGGTVDIASDKTANTQTLVLLRVGTANLNGGTLSLTDKAPTSNPATYAMWSNSGNINLNGTDVFVDLSSNTQKGWAVCAIKIQNKNSIVMNDGTLAVVGGDRTCVFRADSDGSAVTLKGGEVIGYVGSFIGHQPGDGATSSFSINDKAKIDLYYTKSVVLKGNGNMTATGVDANIWAKNAGWTSGSRWLTTGNWDDKDFFDVLLDTKNGPFVLSMNGDRLYPASGTPALTLTADGTLFVLDADSIAAGEINRIEAKGDLKLNVPADKTVNIGSTSYGDVLRAIGNLTVTGKGTLNLTSANSGLVALGDININGGITVNINGGNNAIGTSGGGIYFEDCKVVVNETKKNADFVICSTATDDSSIVFGKGADVTVYGNRSLILRNKGANGSEIRFEDGSKVTAVSTGGYIVYNQGDGGTCEIVFNGGEHSFTTTAEDTASDWWDGFAIRNNKGGVTINGGSITASCTRSPIYATGAVVLKAGTVNLKSTKTYGIEAPSITVDGGTLKVDAEASALLTKSYKQTAGTVEITSKAGDAVGMSGASYVVNADKSITASAVPLTFEVSGGKFTAVAASAGIRMHASWKPTADQAAAAGISVQDYHEPTTLTFKVSGGEVDVKAGGQVIYLQGGNTASTGIFEISGGKLKAENTANFPVLQFQCKEGSAISFSGNADVDLIASNEANERDTLEVNTATPITISDNADVSVSATGGNAVNLRLGTLTLKDNAKLTAVNTAMTKKTWAESAALWVAGLSISDKAVLNVENTTNCAGPVLGIAIEGNTGKTTVNPVFAGGTVNVKVNDNSTTLGDKWEHRVFGIWISFPETDVTLKGTAFDIVLNSAAKNNTASAGFYVQNVPTGFDFNVTGGSIKFEAKQQEALFRAENPKNQASGFNISGGTITGVGYQFWTGFDGQVFTVTGEPTIDYQNLSGKARTGGKSVDDKGVSFLSGKAFRDNGAYIKTGVDPVVPGNPPTSDLVLTSVIVTASVAVVAAIVIVILRRRASRESLED